MAKIQKSKVKRLSDDAYLARMNNISHKQEVRHDLALRDSPIIKKKENEAKDDL